MENSLSKTIGLSPAVITEIQQVLSKYPEVEKAILYGSRAKGNFREGSDIDLTLFGPALNLTKQFEIENDLDELLLPYKIDLSIFSKIENKDLKNHIEKVGLSFYLRES